MDPVFAFELCLAAPGSRQLLRAGRAGLVFGFGAADVARIGPALVQLRRLWQQG